ncbi:ATP-binding protein [Lentzea sp. NPDC003310]|uniref:NACHT domain-containing protein n=1 Tax=Lentzea sp. NPDC003310 TaxID=3154447 RepID=UPI0033B07171
MSRPDLFSYEGALRVLGQYNHPWLDKTDTFLGVGILVGGAVEPNILSLVDPKNEATNCLRKILNGVTDRLTGLSGQRRQDLIAAAHTIIVVTSVFEAFSEEIGDDFQQLKISDSEKFRILHAEPPENRKESSALPSLTSLEVPAPNAVSGFYENLSGSLSHFFTKSVQEVRRFLNKLDARAPRLNTGDFASAVVLRARNVYYDHYLGVASDIPEFRVWTFLGEHAATRELIEQRNAKLSIEITAARTESLELFAQLLSRLSPALAPPGEGYRKSLRNVAEAVLSRPIIGSNIDPASVDAVFPTVEDGFIVPGFRLAVQDDKTQASSKTWWEDRTLLRDDLDLFLAAHLTGADSTRRPLLVLGNPGAGKSLLMEVLASRLPADRFTVVNVQLRKVRAEDGIQDQVETALGPVLGKGVDWVRLADSCGDTVPVVLLDGFDELIQASGVHQSNYLKQVRDFQQLQVDRGRPVAVVVTSRMLVADRARIPDGVPIVKLEEFDDDRIARWLDTWNTTNCNTAGFHPLEPAALGQHSELARQPLLLLMLAIYAADPDQPPLDDASLSNSELYRRLIAMFVTRQVSQKGREQLAPAVVKQRSAESSWQLGIAAFAMFNRGHQYVTAPELNEDLAVFARKPAAAGQSTTFDTPVDDADRTVENFFFIHSPSRNDGATPEQRTYEFLHATFGEYLIAEVTMKLLRQLAAARALPAANPYEVAAPPDDSLLYALISHQAFIKRKPIIEFGRGLFSALTDTERAGVLQTLDDLIRTCQHRPPNDPYLRYRPTPSTIINRIAHYSANLVCLRVLLDTNVPTPIIGSLADWRATVHLWRAGLGEESWQEVISKITLLEDNNWFIVEERDNDIDVVQEARLLGNAALESALYGGAAFYGQDATPDRQEQHLVGRCARWQSRILGSGSTGRVLPAGVRALHEIVNRLDTGTRMSRDTASYLWNALSRDASRLPHRVVERVLGHLLPRFREEFDAEWLGPFELVSILCAHPALADVGEISSQLLSRRFRQWMGSAIGSVILVWAVSRSSEGRLDDSFQDLARMVRQAAAPHADYLSTMYLPIEVFEYLAEPRAIEPRIDDSTLSQLSSLFVGAADDVSPQTILKLTGRFAGSTGAGARARFVACYLEHRTVGATAGEQAVLDELTAQASNR